MRHWIVCAFIGPCIGLCLAGCGERTPKEAPRVAQQIKQQPARPLAQPPAAAPAPVILVPSTVTSTGSDPVFMVSEGLKSAIRAVNGTSAQAGPLDFGVKAAEALRSASAPGKAPPNPAQLIKDPAYAEQVLLLSKGVVSEFRVARVSGPDARGIYAVSIEMKIVKSATPAAAAPAVAAKR